MSENNSLRNQFLVAMPGMVDGHFDHSVTLLCEHNEEGALGLVINRPTDLNLREMLAHMEIGHDELGEEVSSRPVFWGGPVHPERGFVLHTPAGDWESSMPVGDDVSLTTSRDVLSAIGQGEGPSQFLIALGYAGWGPGQLEGEILQNAWLNTPPDTQIIFDLAIEQRWAAAARLLGIDAHLLSGDAGHA